MDDAALVAAMARKDPQGLDGIYRRYADRLHAYARSLVGDGQSAADIVHDTFLLANEHVKQLRDPGRLRQWLYAIARNEGLRQLRHRSRQASLDQAPEPVAEVADPAQSAQSAEVAELVRAAMAGMAPGDREIAELALRHGLSTSDIAAILAVPENNARARLSRARQQLIVSLGVMLVARHRTCPGLRSLLGDWDGKLNPLLRKRLHRHIEDCAECTGVRRQRLDPAALLSAYSGLPFAAFGSSRFGRSRRVPGKVLMVCLAALLFAGSVWFFAAAQESAAPGPLPTLLTSVSPDVSSPTASELPVAAVSDSPFPSPSVAPTRPVRPSTPPPPLAFDASGSCRRVGAAVTLTITVTANADLDTASATSSIGQVPLQVSGRGAQGARTASSPSTTVVTWSVSIQDRSGRRLQGPNRTTSCI